jgi:hypothetical protein
VFRCAHVYSFLVAVKMKNERAHKMKQDRGDATGTPIANAMERILRFYFAFRATVKRRPPSQKATPLQKRSRRHWIG